MPTDVGGGGYERLELDAFSLTLAFRKRAGLGNSASMPNAAWTCEPPMFIRLYLVPTENRAVCSCLNGAE